MGGGCEAIAKQTEEYDWLSRRASFRFACRKAAQERGTMALKERNKKAIPGRDRRVKDVDH